MMLYVIKTVSWKGNIFGKKKLSYYLARKPQTYDEIKNKSDISKDF